MREIHHARAQVRFLRALVDLQNQQINAYRSATFTLIDRLSKVQLLETMPEIHQFNSRQQDLFHKELQLTLALNSLEKS
jgi:hypothetical protein